MGKRVTMAFIGTMGWLIVGCQSALGPATTTVDSADPVLAMLNKGIIQLTVNINGLDKRMADLEQAGQGGEPTLRELYALDLSGWKLHQQSWMLQREHLQFAKQRLLEAKSNPSERPRLREQWIRHEQDYEHALEDLRQQRLALEKRRLQAERRLIEQSFL